MLVIDTLLPCINDGTKMHTDAYDAPSHVFLTDNVYSWPYRVVVIYMYVVMPSTWLQMYIKL